MGPEDALRPAVPAAPPPAGAGPAADAATGDADDGEAYELALSQPYLDDGERDLAGRMIGRPARGRSAAAVRCHWGLPAVLRVDPYLDDGTPFPTLFWLACPLANRHVGRLENAGHMVELNDAVARDPVLGAAYDAAARRYLAARERLGGPLPRAAAAGGMPARVKCLHALYGHYLATGDNPVGAWVAERVEPMPCPGPCVTPAGDGWKDRGG